MQPLGTKESLNLFGQKIGQPLGTKKNQANQAPLRTKINHATSWAQKKSCNFYGGKKLRSQ